MKKLSSKYKNGITWLIAILVSLSCLLIPETHGVTLQIKLYLTCTVLVILIFAFNLMSQTAAALALIYSYVLLGITDIQSVFSVFATPILWSVLGGLIIANILLRIGLLKRISLKCIALMGGTYKGIVYGLALAGLILTILVGSATIPMVIFAFGICKSLDLKPSREAAGIMLSAGLSTNMAYSFIFNVSYYMATSVGAAAGVQSALLSYVQYFAKNIPMFLFFIVLIGLIPYILKPEGEWKHTKESFVEEYQGLGKITKDEVLGAIACIAILIFMLTTKYHGINIMWGLAFIPLFLFLPGINVGSEKDITDVKWSVFVFAAASVTIGNVAASLGIGQIVANIMIPVVSGLGAKSFLFFSMIFLFLAKFLMTPLSLITTFAGPLAKIASSLGINPQTVYISMITASDSLIFPYQGAMYYIIFAMGMIKMKDWVKLMSIKLGIGYIFYFALLLTYWSATGFLYN